MVLALAILVAFVLSPAFPRLAVFWAFGLAFGFVMQRSRFCFVTGFSNFYLFRDGRMLKSILAGLAVATVGFTIVMYGMVPDSSTGAIPVNAYASPFGWHLALAGLIFGVGMILAGGCIAGTLFRIGEGAIPSLVALFGVLIGIGVLLHNWGWWWPNYISKLPRVWLPNWLGWPGAILITLAVLAAAYFLVHRSEPRFGKMAGPIMATPGDTRPRKGLARWLPITFTASIPIALGGVVLGLLNTLEYWTVDRPWGITGEISRWSSNIMSFVGLPASETVTVPGT